MQTMCLYELRFRLLFWTDDDPFTAEHCCHTLINYRCFRTKAYHPVNKDDNALRMNVWHDAATAGAVSGDSGSSNEYCGIGKSVVSSPSRTSPSVAEDVIPTINNVLEEDTMPLSTLDISGRRIGARFAEEAKKTLSDAEFKDLQHFLTRSTPPRDAEYLHKQISEKLQTFYAAEVLESGEPCNRLASPSGPEDADMGLIMHCQSKEGEIGQFWDMESRSIQTLAEKGLSDEFVFGYDWHWRGEPSCRGRGPCPTTQWTKAQSILHDTLSCDILEILPLPLLIIAGSCTKKQYRKTLSNRARRLELVIAPDSIITFDLDFKSDGLRRITAYIDHPSASFFHPKVSAQISVRQDAAINFFLLLLGKDGVETTFIKRQAEHRRGVPGSAPLPELWQYVNKEEFLQRRLAKHEYEPSFWTWAHTFLKEDPAAILKRGDSVVGKIRQEIGDRIRTRNLEPERSAKIATNNRQRNATRYGYTTREYWDGHSVKVQNNGDFRLFVSGDRPALILRASKLIF